MTEGIEPSRGAVIGKLLEPLRSDLFQRDFFPESRPLLAHYTSMATVETILRSGEIWFSSPFYMNDFEEVRFGIENSVAIVDKHEGLFQALSSLPHRTMFVDSFRRFHDEFTVKHSEELYLFCLSRHDPDDNDGLLSMWRGYGGNGTGAALVFDTGKINAAEGSPLLIGAVEYASTEQRLAWIKEKVDFVVTVINENSLSPTDMYYVAFYLYERIKLFALFTKHAGFREEQEWRVVYMPERDALKKFEGFHTFSVGPKGIQPKLRFPIAPIPGLTDNDLSLSKIICRVLLGPNVSSPLAATAAKRMLKALGHPELVERVRSSGIPYR